METERSGSVKKGILLVAFGVHTVQAVYHRVGLKVQIAFPDIPVRWAFTSNIMRKKMAGAGQVVDSVEMSLARMMSEGITHVAVQALHVISGREHHDLTINCHLFGRMCGGFQQVLMGLPLLGTGNDMERVANALISVVPDERDSREAVIFMGHGSPHPANAHYTTLMYYLQQTDANIFVGTMSSLPGIAGICGRLREQNITSAYLLPCLAVVGNHTLKDMVGDNENSWKSVIKRHGISCKPVLKGLAEHDAIVAIWVDYLKTVIGDFS